MLVDVPFGFVAPVGFDEPRGSVNLGRTTTGFDGEVVLGDQVAIASAMAKVLTDIPNKILISVNPNKKLSNVTESSD